jgi:uncharacterized protein (TIGR02271 family)
MANETTVAGGARITAPVVVGLFKNADDAHGALTQLREQGFSSSQIGAAFRDKRIGSHLDPSDAGTVSRDRESWWDKVKDAFRPDNRAEGGREARDTATDSNYQPETYSGGDYEYDLAADEFQGSLMGTGIPSNRAAYLTSNLESGGAIVTVSEANRTDEAERILSTNHAEVRYAERDEVVGQKVAGTDETRIDAAASTGREATDAGYADRRSVEAAIQDVERVQLFGEVLRVHKERINRGEVRVRKDVITENQTIEVPVVREELVLERVAIPGNTPAPSANIGRSQEVLVPLSEERVRLEKEPVVREEVKIGKREVPDVAKVSGDVRREEVRVGSDPDATRGT